MLGWLSRLFHRQPDVPPVPVPPQRDPEAERIARELRQIDTQLQAVRREADIMLRRDQRA